MKKIPAILLGVAALVAVVLALVFWLTGDAVKVVQSQLSAIRDGDIAKAYTYTSADFQDATSESDFGKFVADYPALKNNKKVNFNSREIKNKTATLIGTLESEDGGTSPVEYRLVKEDGKWKILGISMEKAGVTPTGDSEDYALTQTFTGAGYGYTIEYPASWVMEERGETTVLFSGAEGSPDWDATVNIQNITSDDLTGFVQQLKSQFTPDMQSQFSAEKVYTYMAADGTRTQGSEFTVEYTYNSKQFRQRQIVLPRPEGGIVHAWAYTAPVGIYNTYETVAESMLSTWELID